MAVHELVEAPPDQVGYYETDGREGYEPYRQLAVRPCEPTQSRYCLSTRPLPTCVNSVRRSPDPKSDARQPWG